MEQMSKYIKAAYIVAIRLLLLYTYEYSGYFFASYIYISPVIYRSRDIFLLEVHLSETGFSGTTNVATMYIANFTALSTSFVGILFTNTFMPYYRHLIRDSSTCYLCLLFSLLNHDLRRTLHEAHFSAICSHK